MNKKNVITLLFVVQIGLLAPIASFAWGAQGHRLVVETAFSLLSDKAKQKIQALLGGYSTDLAAVWMDSVRINHVPQYTYMKNWHFINMDSGQTYAQVANQDDAVYNLQRMINFFNHMPANVSKDSVVMNLKILFHIMGDITQPLHVGYGSDIGGNDDPVTTQKFNSTGNNLHHVWDDIIIIEGKINQTTCLNFCHQLTQAQIKNVTQGTAEAWMLQSRSYLPQVYACHPKKNVNTTVTTAYLDSNVKIVQQQLAYASLRLAAVLEKAFGS